MVHTQVVHTVGPKYNQKYRTAAENALHHCYFHCLEEMVEAGHRSIAFCCVHTDKKQYPRQAAAHIVRSLCSLQRRCSGHSRTQPARYTVLSCSNPTARSRQVIRTVRRFLEKYGNKIDALCFTFANAGEKSAYDTVLPLYFPRTKDEQYRAVSLLPKDVGNEWGETVVAERQVLLQPLTLLVVRVLTQNGPFARFELASRTQIRQAVPRWVPLLATSTTNGLNQKWIRPDQKGQLPLPRRNNITSSSSRQNPSALLILRR